MARNLQIAVRDWVSNLKQSKASKPTQVIEKCSDFLVGMFPLIILSATFFGLSNWFKPSDSFEIINSIMRFFSIATLSYVVGRIFVIQMYRQLSQSKELTFICLTHGDRERKKKLSDRRKRKKRLGVFFATLLLLSIPANIFSNLLYEEIFSQE